MTEKIKRKHSLSKFGFGIDAMKSKTVCKNCNSLENSKRSTCSVCGEQLPRMNLFDYYKAHHRNCPECGNILSDSMDYCTNCGSRIKKH